MCKVHCPEGTPNTGNLEETWSNMRHDDSSDTDTNSRRNKISLSKNTKFNKKLVRQKSQSEDNLTSNSGLGNFLRGSFRSISRKFSKRETRVIQKHKNYDSDSIVKSRPRTRFRQENQPRLRRSMSLANNSTILGGSIRRRNSVAFRGIPAEVVETKAPVGTIQYHTIV